MDSDVFPGIFSKNFCFRLKGVRLLHSEKDIVMIGKPVESVESHMMGSYGAY